MSVVSPAETSSSLEGLPVRWRADRRAPDGVGRRRAGCVFTVGVFCMAIAVPGSAADRAVRYTVDGATVRVVTDLVLSNNHLPFRKNLIAGSEPAAVRVTDRRTGQRVHSTVRAGVLEFRMTAEPGSKAEPRARIEEAASAELFWKARGDAFVFASDLLPGASEIVLPPGYAVTQTSLPGQISTEGGVAKIGIIVTGDHASRVSIDAVRGDVRADAKIEGSFRAEDERRVTYWLDDPAAHALHLALDLLATEDGQTHVFSVLRADDHISNPRATDADTGESLATELLSAADAAKVPGAPSRMSPSATVMVVSLPAPIHTGEATRVRLFQSATDEKGYRLLPDGQLRWDRFLARLETVIVLPAGWLVTAVDQPVRLGRDSEGRQTLAFLHPSGDSPKLMLTARRASAR